ncbi:hypothetical protein AGLY_006182 [Aphis glycines]|uniref:Uncharacterized protein n=1 Tax=Aphis glycines TaxID=307491 RepID=A0A6G0TTY3_APHGL|nr:hypothetical protein AGLY_006182 [Aphis glycines]
MNFLWLASPTPSLGSDKKYKLFWWILLRSYSVSGFGLDAILILTDSRNIISRAFISERIRFGSDLETLSASDLSNVRVLAAEGGVRWPPLLYTDPLSECERDVDLGSLGLTIVARPFIFTLLISVGVLTGTQIGLDTSIPSLSFHGLNSLTEGSSPTCLLNLHPSLLYALLYFLPLVSGSLLRDTVSSSTASKSRGGSSSTTSSSTTSALYSNHLDGCSNLGGSDFCILSNTRIGDISWFGGSICANSISTLPKAPSPSSPIISQKSSTSQSIWMLLNTFFFFASLLPKYNDDVRSKNLGGLSHLFIGNYNICPHHAWTTVPVKNDVNKVNAAFCGMRFQQYRTSLTMFYWKSPFRDFVAAPPSTVFSLFRPDARRRRIGYCYRTHASRRSDVCVGRGLTYGGEQSSGPKYRAGQVRKTRIWKLFGEIITRPNPPEDLWATCYGRRK